MVNKYDEFLSGIEGKEFDSSSEEAVSKLVELFSGKLPDMLLDVFKEHNLKDEYESDEFVFYGIDRIVEENTDYIPGANLHPLGLYTFASTADGDAICFDSNDSMYPVYQCSHSLLEDETEICFYKGGMQSIPFNYENVIKLSPCLAESFEDFVDKLISDDIELFSVTEMLDNL